MLVVNIIKQKDNENKALVRLMNFLYHYAQVVTQYLSNLVLNDSEILNNFVLLLSILARIIKFFFKASHILGTDHHNRFLVDNYRDKTTLLSARNP